MKVSVRLAATVAGSGSGQLLSIDRVNKEVSSVTSKLATATKQAANN